MDSITELVDNTDITIIPTMNPDGFDRGKEGACSGADYATGRYNEGRKSGCFQRNEYLLTVIREY